MRRPQPPRTTPRTTRRSTRWPTNPSFSAIPVLGQNRSKEFDPESVGTAVAAQTRQNGLFSAIGRSQHTIREASLRRHRAGQRQRKLDHLGTTTRLRPKRFNRCNDAMREFQEGAAWTRRSRSNASLHRHPALRPQPGTRAKRHPEQ